jgi:hypothetical protein
MPDASQYQITQTAFLKKIGSKTVINQVKIEKVESIVKR